jgi:hypothetical protein
MSRALRRWLRRRRPVAPTQSLNLSPPCSECGARTATVFLAEYTDGWRLAFQGIAGGNPPGGDPISGERAQAIRDALSPPYEPAKIRAADFYDDFGYCISCEKFYCATHWQVSTTGGGTCPAGHFKSLDPHWHPDWDDL